MVKFDVDLDTLPAIVANGEDHFYFYYENNPNRYWWFKDYFTERKMTKTAPEGREVVIIFQALNFENKNLFYTDANGLEMQRRELNLTKFQVPLDYVKLPFSL